MTGDLRRKLLLAAHRLFARRPAAPAAILPMRRDSYHDFVTVREVDDALSGVLLLRDRKDALLARSGFHNVVNARYEQVVNLRDHSKRMRVTFASSAWTGR